MDNRTYHYIYTGSSSQADTVLRSGWVVGNNLLDNDLGVMGVFLAGAIILTMALLGAWNPAVSLVMGTVGLIFAVFMGFISIGAGFIIGLIVVMAIAIYKVKT